ncbi:hypothetical protein ACA910_003566 [Epithemia clementina (nom. ined.)]
MEDGSSFTVKAGDAATCCTELSESSCFPFRGFWNVDWSINVDYQGITNDTISDFVFVLAMDSDPTCDTCFANFYPLTETIAFPFFDHSFGDNSFTNGAGRSSSNAEFVFFKETNNVVQNSFNPAFLASPGSGLEFFDPSVEGTYVIALRVGKFKYEDRTSTTCSCGGTNAAFESYVSLEVPIIVAGNMELYASPDSPDSCLP